MKLLLLLTTSALAITIASAWGGFGGYGGFGRGYGGFGWGGYGGYGGWGYRPRYYYPHRHSHSHSVSGRSGHKHNIGYVRTSHKHSHPHSFYTEAHPYRRTTSKRPTHVTCDTGFKYDFAKHRCAKIEPEPVPVKLDARFLYDLNNLPYCRIDNRPPPPPPTTPAPPPPPPPAPKIFTCEAPGFFPNPTHCGKFNQCRKLKNGSLAAAEFDCPDNTIFNPDLNVCDDPALVPELAGCLQFAHN